MAIDNPTSDTSRAIHHEPNMDYPKSVTIQLVWEVDGVQRYRTIDISSDRFFGHGQYGAPIEGAALIGMIENARREGPFIPPKVNIRGKTKR
jgi:hypothetical protein